MPLARTLSAMATIETLKALCYDDRGGLKPRTECRSALINHLILEELIDVMDAEDEADAALNTLNLWPSPEDTKPATEPGLPVE